MNNPQYLAIIEAATETRNIDFKRSMNWRTSTQCAKFELLKDIAAMANAGGGFLIIGRDEPLHETGTLTEEEAGSFDPTEVNKSIHRYLAPIHECRVECERSGADLLVVLDVPEFETSPLIFQQVGNCGDSGCKKPHFLAGDIFIRTKAQQTQRIATAEEMRDLINRGVRKTSTDFVTAIQRMLSAPQSIEEPLAASPYDEESAHEERDFFGPIFYPRVAHAGYYDMSIRPVKYKKDRLELRRVPNKVREYAFVINRNGLFDSVPYDGLEGSNFAGGCRLRIMKPPWRRIEAVSLWQSGLYRIARAFPEDYEPNKERTAARLKDTDRELWIDTFVEYMTMFHLLARNVMRDMGDDEDEQFQVDIRIDGLAGRTLDGNNVDPLESFLIGLRGQHGTENSFFFPLRTTLRSMEVEAVSLAAERCATVLWTFGLTGDSISTFQRRLLGNSEPHAFPASGS